MMLKFEDISCFGKNFGYVVSEFADMFLSFLVIYPDPLQYGLVSSKC